MARPTSLAALLSVLLASIVAEAQSNLQLWGDIVIDWQKRGLFEYVLDTEPKVLLAAPGGDPGWATIEVTPNVAYVATRWLDLTSELAAAYTAQTDDVHSVEVTPRVGVRLHLFSWAVPVRVAGHVVRDRELPPKRRLVLRDYVRMEWRNLFYSDDTDDSSARRLRNRLELLFPLNRALVTDGGARYLLAEWEWFIPVSDVAERFANKQRIRAGLGWRRGREWRFEGLYVFDRSRNTIEEGFTTSAHAINLRMRRVY
jgi:hypothetical protein